MPRFQKLLRRPVSYEFPDELELTAITLTPAYLSMSWHQGKGGWERAADKDYQQQEGLELYEYRAHRERYDRSVVRFEWRFADGFAASEGKHHVIDSGDDTRKVELACL